MKKIDDLYQLIQSLSMQEKRHFKLFSGRYTVADESNYIKLFNLIATQKKYNKEGFKTKLKSASFSKHLAFEKHHLNELINRSLRLYHSGHSVDVQLKELLIDAEILHEKSLYNQCKKVLRRATKLAYKYERFIFIPEIVRLESRLYDLVNLEVVYKEESVALKKMQTINKFRILSNKVATVIASAHQIRKKADLLWFEKLMQNPLLKDEKQADSFTAKVYFFYIKGVYFEMKGDLINSYKSRKRFMELMEASPEQLEIHTKNYLTVLNNLAISQLDLKKFDEAIQTVQKIKNVPLQIKSGRSEDIQISSFVFSAIIELNCYIRTGDFKKGHDCLPQIEIGLKKFDGKIQKQFEVVIHNSIKNIYFGIGDLRKALQWSGRIINETNSSVRQDIQSMTRIFNLIVHYELGNLDMLEYNLKSTYRFLMKSQRMYKVETIVLQYIRKSAFLVTKNEIFESFKKVHKQLLPLTKDRFEKKAFEEFDCISWLESKIEGQTFEEIIKERNRIKT